MSRAGDAVLALARQVDKAKAERSEEEATNPFVSVPERLFESMLAVVARAEAMHSTANWSDRLTSDLDTFASIVLGPSTTGGEQ